MLVSGVCFVLLYERERIKGTWCLASALAQLSTAAPPHLWGGNPDDADVTAGAGPGYPGGGARLPRGRGGCPSGGRGTCAEWTRPAGGEETGARGREPQGDAGGRAEGRGGLRRGGAGGEGLT